MVSLANRAGGKLISLMLGGLVSLSILTPRSSQAQVAEGLTLVATAHPILALVATAEAGYVYYSNHSQGAKLKEIAAEMNMMAGTGQPAHCDARRA